MNLKNSLISLSNVTLVYILNIDPGQAYLVVTRDLGPEINLKALFEESFSDS